MFHIRKMSAEDFEFAVRLTDTMNWELGEADFEFAMELDPDGCLVLLCKSEKVGVATAISYGKVGWLGNVIVSEKHRGKGGGSLLVRHATDYLTNKGVETIGLYAYLDRTPFYAEHGFQSEAKFKVLKGRGFSASDGVCAMEAGEDDMPQIVDLDRLYFGGSRTRLLEPVLLDPSSTCYVCKDDDQILGFAVAKKYGETSEIGPLVCERGCYDIAINLLKAGLRKAGNCEVSLCVPEKEPKILDLLMRHGFREHLRLARMIRGTPVTNDHDYVYVAESLERG